ncbi:MAG: hemolysin family protein [Planctomycetes bacterium]|nr:hemolysin family protein [Planctomycetota bacterium]
MWTVELIVVAVMIAFNSVFAGYEIALASVGAARLEALARQGRRGAASALRMKHSIEASLAVVQLGITLVGAIAAATGGAGAEELIVPILRHWGLSAGASQFLAIGIVVAPLTVLTITFGELVPKVFSLRNKEWVCLKLSPVMEGFSYSVWPAVWFFESAVTWIMKWGERGSKDAAGREATLQELRGAAAVARMDRLIGHREEGIIVSASRLSTTPLRQIMLPAEHIGMLATDMTLSEALIAAHQDMHTRFPVTETPADPQRIIGYLNFKDVVAALRLAPRDPSLRNIVRRLRSFDAEASVADCLESLMRERNHIAVVKDGERIVGMVTLEDIVEELVGEIHDEFDRLPAHLVPAGPGWIAGGFVSLQQLRETAEIELPPISDKPIHTLNDWIVERLGQPPHGGEEIRADGCRILVRKVRRLLVQEAYLSRDEAQAASARNDAEESF